MEQTGALVPTPELREAVRQQIVVAGLRTSQDIAMELGLRHVLVLKLLERFEAVGALRSVQMPERSDIALIVEGSLSARFRDLTSPLW